MVYEVSSVVGGGGAVGGCVPFNLYNMLGGGGGGCVPFNLYNMLGGGGGAVFHLIYTTCWGGGCVPFNLYNMLGGCVPFHLYNMFGGAVFHLIYTTCWGGGGLCSISCIQHVGGAVFHLIYTTCWGGGAVFHFIYTTCWGGGGAVFHLIYTSFFVIPETLHRPNSLRRQEAPLQKPARDTNEDDVSFNITVVGRRHVIGHLLNMFSCTTL